MALKSLFRRLFPASSPTLPHFAGTSPEQLSEREILAALRVGTDAALWRAIHQLLDVQTARALAEALDADNQLQAPLAAYYAGAARHLQIFKEFLIAERERAMEIADAEEGEV